MYCVLKQGNLLTHVYTQIHDGGDDDDDNDDFGMYLTMPGRVNLKWASP